METPKAICAYTNACSTYEIEGDSKHIEDVQSQLDSCRLLVTKIKLSGIFRTITDKTEVRAHTLSVTAELPKWKLKEADLGVAFAKRVANVKRLR